MFENCPSLDDRERTCSICGAEDSFVRHEGDTLCTSCCHAPGQDRGVALSTDDPWGSWWEHRAAEYDTLTGPDRIKMVGGFRSAYDY